jgi:hypothetical protein
MNRVARAGSCRRQSVALPGDGRIVATVCRASVALTATGAGASRDEPAPAVSTELPWSGLHS